MPHPRYHCRLGTSPVAWGGVCHRFGTDVKLIGTILVLSPCLQVGDNGSMKKPKYPNGLREAMEDLGKGPTELADKLDTNKQNITRWSSGQRKLTVEWARRLAPLLETTPEALLLGDQQTASAAPRERSKLVQVPLLDFVSAGKLKSPSSQIPVEDVPLLAFADLGRGDFFALTVEGDSMDRISPDGSVIVVNQAERTLISGKAYVFSDRGKAAFKVWRPEPPRFAPFSTNPVHEPVYVKTKTDAEKLVVGRVKRTVLDL